MAGIRKIILLAILLGSAILSGCTSISDVKRYHECCSPDFEKPTEFVIYDFSYDDVYKVFGESSTTKMSMNDLRTDLMKRAKSFAAKRGKSIMVLGRQDHERSLPDLFGFPIKAELIFALIDEEEYQPRTHKIADGPALSDIE